MRRPDAILVEAVALPSAGEMYAGAGSFVELCDLRLSRDGFEREERVLDGDTADDLGGVDLLGVINRHHEIPLVRQAL